ncbi:DUF5391 family protein [Bacillus haynesii]
MFCSLLVTASLSPLADSGPHTNKFGTLGCGRKSEPF